MDVRNIPSEDPGEAWSAFLARRPEAGLGHAWAWRQVLEGGYRKATRYLAAFRGKRISGIVPLAHMRGPLTANELVSLPFLDHASILAEDDDSAAALRAAAVETARELGARGVELRGIEPEVDSEAERATLVLELPEEPEALWKSFKPKVRNQVRKAEKSGLRTEVADPGRLADFHAIYARNMRDLGSPPHGLRFFEAVRDAFGDDFTLFLTLEREDRPVGAALALRFAGTVTVPWASSLREAFSRCPNHSLYWKILETTVQHGARRFDFGRSHRAAGTYHFKTQWGARPFPLRWTRLDLDGQEHAPRLLKPSDHSRLVGLWSRLPVWASTLVGSCIRRQISN